MPRTTAAIRTHFFRQIAAIRIVRRGRLDLDADNPVMPRIERELRIEPIDEGRPVLVQEGDETDGALLRVALRELFGVIPQREQWSAAEFARRLEAARAARRFAA